ncbi:hypothetical protein PsorP6_005989 [Peronosclerospora sorghi]|uniref:Uncharacterized protein n=1 Tax=Peronosclerospora sorghi TaxID=230839 RepID=A0ACC0W415_9STRA|nr:hypothetical protein PsorP6_005989 [Peronosclerospora sorghi]
MGTTETFNEAESCLGACNGYFFYCYETGLQLSSAIVTAVFEKSMVLSSAARQKRTAREITNLMSIDAQRLQYMTPYLHAVWYAALQIIVLCFMLWRQIGVATFTGFLLHSHGPCSAQHVTAAKNSVANVNHQGMIIDPRYYLSVSSTKVLR